MNAVLPEKIAALMSAMADLLENHMRSLDIGDADARLERDAYDHLVNGQRAVASSLSVLAAAMRGYRELPAAPHDESLLADHQSIDVFKAFVAAEEDVLDQVQKDVTSYRAMLGAMEAS